MRIGKVVLGLVALAVLGAAPAAALESLTGVYQGKIKCKGLIGGGKSKSKLDVEVEVNDVDGQLLMNVSDIGTFEGFAATEAKKPDHGKVSVVSCLLSVASQSGAMLHADVKNKAGNPKASMKGTMLRTDDASGDARICNVKVKRISTALPKILPCE